MLMYFWLWLSCSAYVFLAVAKLLCLRICAEMDSSRSLPAVSKMASLSTSDSGQFHF